MSLVPEDLHNLSRAMKSDLFDYVFYRTYVFYLNRKDNTPITYGSIVVSLIQTFCIIDSAIVAQLFFPFEMPTKVNWGILMVLALAFNWYRYERNPNIDIMKAKWGNEHEDEKVKRGILIVIWLATLLLLPILIGIWRHNLN